MIPGCRNGIRRLKKRRGLFFSQVYRDFIVNDLAVSVSCPVYDEEGTLKGILGTHMLLSDIGNYLKNEGTSFKGYVSVIEKDSRYLIANSMGEDNYTAAGDGSLKRNTIDDLSLPAWKSSYEKYRKSQKTEFSWMEGETDWYSNVKEYRKAGLDWVIISVIPGSFFCCRTEPEYRGFGGTGCYCRRSFHLYFLLDHPKAL